MGLLIFNQLLRIAAGDASDYWRIIALIPRREEAVLVHVPREVVERQDLNATDLRKMKLTLRRMSYAEIAQGESDKTIIPITEQSANDWRRDKEELSERQHQLLEQRTNAMKGFLEPKSLTDCFERHDHFGSLVDSARQTGVKKASVYQWMRQLFLYGLCQASLMPRYNRCGNAGTPRYYDAPSSKPGRQSTAQKINPKAPNQRGITEAEACRIVAIYRTFSKPGMTFRRIYDKIVQELWVTEIIWENGRPRPVLPPAGSYPNERQVRYLTERDTSPVERLRRQTTTAHFERNHRGLSGVARDGVAGPGHRYTIDSTVGDIYLAHAYNRDWYAGRAIVYFVVDVWSGAIVGFHACLRAPSWKMAKIALFNAAAPPALRSALWGFDCTGALDPAPTLPTDLLCDRGEYLSHGAHQTSLELAFNAEYNAARRPDLKGLVEVQFRLVKDDAYNRIPGAFDARRKEIELRRGAKTSLFTLAEFCEYLQSFITMRNLTADRSRHCAGELIAAGVDPTPAALWSYGHAIGAGFRASQPDDHLIRHLLVPEEVQLTGHGLFTGPLRWITDDPALQEQVTNARNFGAKSLKGYHADSVLRHLWVEMPGSPLVRLEMAPNSPGLASASLPEYEDLRCYQLTQSPERDRDHQASRLQHQVLTQKLTEGAREKKKNGQQPNLEPISPVDAPDSNTPQDTPANDPGDGFSNTVHDIVMGS